MHHGAHTQITPFDFRGHQVRVLVATDGEPRWIAADVARVLDYRETRDMTRNLDDDEAAPHIVRVRSGNGVEQDREMTVITESGLYSAILRSRKPEAKEFKRWVTREVLPAIRKHGAYMTNQTLEQVLTDPDTIIKIATDLKQERARREELEAESVAQAAQLESAAPKVEYHDQFVADEDLIQFRTLSNQLDVGEQTLRQVLAKHGWIYNDRTQRWSNKEDRLVWESRWRANASKKRYFRLVPHHKAPRINGEVRQTLKITPHGATAIARALKKWGLIEEIPALF